MGKTLTIYWAPSKFLTTGDQWNLLYQEPKPVIETITGDGVPNNTIIKCPATRATLKNVFAFVATHEDTVPIAPGDDQNGIVKLIQPRPSSMIGYRNWQYNLSWLLFAEEPVTARLTAPYFPTVSPADGALLAPGHFDIGQWYRPMNLDYHIPVEANTFSVRENQPLAFLDIETDRQVRFVRYRMTQELFTLSEECVNVSNMYSRGVPLSKRYAQFRQSGLRDIVLSEIKKNVVPL